MDYEKTNKEKNNFVLNEVIKRKILDMYNISKEDVSPKAETPDPKVEDNQE